MQYNDPGLPTQINTDVSNIFDNCWAKTNALEIKHDNKFRPCCVFKSSGQTYDQSITNTLSKYHTLTEEQIKTACNYCIKKSKEGPVGRKAFFDSYKAKGYDFFYDLQLSNVCNLACTMCNSEYSSKWEKLGQQLDRDYLIGFKKHSNRKWNNDTVKHILKDANQRTQFKTVVVSIKGGEPTVQPEIQEFIQSLKHPHHVHLHIVTNLQRWPVWFDTELSKFKSTHITVSLEGIEETYEYSRVHGSWNTFNSNVKKLNSVAEQYNIKWLFGPLITSHTVGDTTRTLEYMKQYKYGDLNNFVYSPQYVNPSILPNNITTNIVNDMQNEFTVLKQSMLNTSYNKKHFDNFIDYTKQLDSVLDVKFIDTPTGKYFKDYF